MRAIWSDRQNCSHNVSQPKVKRIRCLSCQMVVFAADDFFFHGIFCTHALPESLGSYVLPASAP